MNVALGVGLGRAVGSSGEVGPAENLLTWTEELDNAVWSKNVVTVTADDAANPSPPGDGSTTADLCSWGGATRHILQNTAIATAGLASFSTTFAPPAVWERKSVTGTIDGTNYTASVYVQDQSVSGNSLRLFLEDPTGVIRVRLLSIGGALAAHVWGFQLEVGSSPTTYVPRTT